MLIPNHTWFTQRAFAYVWLFCVLGVLSVAPAARAHQPTSQVLTFTGAMPLQPDGPVDLRFRFFTAPMDGTLVFEETQTAMVVGEQFTLRIGDATVGGVPATMFRDNASLWIAFALDVTPNEEIGARTAVASAGYAHAAATVAGPTVRTLNTLFGDVTLAQGANVTITPGANVLTIAASGVVTNVTHDVTLIGDGTGDSPLGISVPLTLNAAVGTTIMGENSTGIGVRGIGGVRGVWGTSTSFHGVFGESASGTGVEGRTNGGADAAGVLGVSSGNGSTGVWGVGTGANAWGVFGRSDGAGSKGVEGRSLNGTGVEGHNTFASPLGRMAGVKGTSSSDNGTGVWGEGGARGLFGSSPNGSGVVATGGLFAGFFDGRVAITGSLELRTLGAAGSTALCRNASLLIGTCSSSLRYKTDVRPFDGGLDIVKRLRPIAFTWAHGGGRDVGLAAEEVEEVEPLLTFRNDKGEIEGVKYGQLAAVFVNAFVEQQAQIQKLEEQITQQQHELAALKAFVCASHPNADVCR